MHQDKVPVLSKIDESWDREIPGNTSLFVQVGDNRVSFCLLDNEKNKYIGIESYRSNLKDLKENDLLTHTRYRSVQVMIENNRSTLIPAMLFDHEEKESYLDFIHDQKYGDETRYDLLEQLQIVNVYAVPGDILQTVTSLFPTARPLHHSTALIKCIWMNFKNRISGRKMFIHVREHDFDLVVFNGKQLEYYNAFHFMAPADIIYFVIFVMEQLDLNPEETGVMLMGNIDKESGIFELLYKYIRNIDFASRNELFKYSHGFNEISEHQYYLLLNFRICGL